jgi:hypothetical protein
VLVKICPLDNATVHFADVCGVYPKHCVACEYLYTIGKTCGCGCKKGEP